MLPEAYPHDWQEWTLGDLFDFSNGINADKSAYGSGVPFANVFEVVINSALTVAQIPGRIHLPKGAIKRYTVKRGDVLFNRTSETPEEVGLASVYMGEQPIAFGGFVFRGQPKTDRLTLGYSKYGLRAGYVREQIVARSQGAIRANIGQRDLKRVRVVLPLPAEQDAIAAVLADADSLIASLERLLSKLEFVRLGLAKQLLTGRTRLPGFTDPWEKTTIAALLRPRTERNVSGAALTVLTCTKHRGFVRSLDYFKSQVFSNDLSSYKIIRRGDIGYPANHIEEGSIGVQELEDVGVVSPIYVVMSPLNGVDTYFLQRLLRLDSFRQQFAKHTNASVDRRGSLRWPAFSQLELTVPCGEEQIAVARVLRDADAQIDVVKQRVEKAKAVKQGIAQQLLTGCVRLPDLEAVA
jgi:type I restriction enzyme S subunit